MVAERFIIRKTIVKLSNNMGLLIFEGTFALLMGLFALWMYFEIRKMNA